MNGAIWVAWGEDHLKRAVKSAQSFKRFNPELGTALFTIDSFSHKIFDKIIEKPELKGFTGLFTLPKIACMSETPFERTIFFDYDTLILADLNSSFSVLDKYDLAGCQVLLWQRARHAGKFEAEVPALCPQINTGVLVYTSTPTTIKFLKYWDEISRRSYEVGETCDQVTFREAIWTSDIKFCVMPEQMNKRLIDPCEIIYTDKPAPMVVHLPILTPANTVWKRVRQKISELYFLGLGQ
jgi:hypothetical protein